METNVAARATNLSGGFATTDESSETRGREVGLAGEGHVHARATLPRTDAAEQTCAPMRKSCQKIWAVHKTRESSDGSRARI